MEPIYCQSYEDAEALARSDQTIMMKVDCDPRFSNCWAIVEYPYTGLPEDEEWEEDDRRSDGTPGWE